MTRRSMIPIAFLAVGFCCAIADAADENLPDSVRTLQQVVRHLIEEAEAASENGWKWPREEPNIAGAVSFESTPRQLLSLLSRRQHRYGAIDGYVKWQLLSFKPDFGELSDRQWDQLIRGWPGLIPRPQFDRREQAAIDALEKSPRPPKPLIEQVAAAIERLNKEIEAVEQATGPARKYIDAIVEAMPAEGGRRYLAEVQRFVIHASAGTNDCANLARDLDKTTEDLRTDRDLPGGVRRNAIALIQRLGQVRVVNYAGVVEKMSGEAEVSDRAILDFGEKDIESLVAWLSGREPPKKHDNKK